MTSDRLTGLGRLMSGSGVVMAVCGMAVVVLQGRWELATGVLAPENALIGVGFGALAWTLFPSEPRNGAIWAYAVAAFSGGAFVVSLAAFTTFAPDDVLDTFIDVLPRPADLPLPAAVAAQGLLSLWLPSVFLVLTLGLLLFPNGRPPSPKWRWVVRGEVAAVVVATLGNILLFHPWTTAPINTFDSSVGKFVELLMFPVLLGTLVSVASLVVRYRRSSAVVRRQIGWIALGGSVYAIAQLVRYAIWGGVGDEGNGRESFASLTSLLGLIPLALLILSFWVAITKYRLYDLDRVISKSVTYIGLVGVITGLFALVVAVPTLVLGRSDDGRPNVVLALAATALVAVLFEPIRARMQRWANRLVYGHRSSPHEVLSQVTSRLSDSGPDGGADDLARVLAQGTGATLAAVWLRDGELIEPLGSWSVDGALPSGLIRADSLVDDRTVVVPVRHGDDVLGDVSITKPRDDPPTPADRELLADVASGAGLMLRNVSLNRQLEQRARDVRESRLRLISAQDAERHRLDRDLHDGAQQQVVALKVKLGIAKTLAEREGAEQVAALVSGLAEETQRAVDALRAIAHGIYPPLLEAEGLEVALRAAERTSASRLTVSAAGIGRYERHVEETAYFCVLEAVERSRMAGATKVDVSVADVAGELVIEIASAGGLTEADLTAVTDRVDAFDGTTTVDTAPDGATRFSCRLPVGEHAMESA